MDGGAEVRKKYIIVTVMVILTFVLTSCDSTGYQKTISKELGIDVSSGNELSYSDDHGGFHGDGTTFVSLSFSDEKVLEQIKENTNWKAFPLDDTVRTLVYGVSDETRSIGPFLTDNEGDPLVPDIQNGYYILIDRQVKGEQATGADILHRNSFKFTLGIYDVDTNILYFCELDT